MSGSICEKLDDYLLGWLPPGEAAEFERHLAGCPTCRVAHSLQAAIDARLRKSSELSAAIPSGLVERTRMGIHAARRHMAIRWTAGIAAAAAVVLAVLIGQFRTADRGRLEEQVAQAVTPKAANGAMEELTLSTSVKLADPAAGIVVERPTRDPNIRIVWIYPTVTPPAPTGGGPVNSIFPPHKGEFL